MTAEDKPEIVIRQWDRVPPEHLEAIIEDRWQQMMTGLRADAHGDLIEDTSKISRKLYDTIRRLAAEMVQGITFDGAAHDFETALQERLTGDVQEYVKEKVKAFAVEVETYRMASGTSNR